jgi:flagellar basal-body rod modification protein FlgD
MSTIDTNQNQSLTAILDKLGVNKNDADAKKKDSLGQEDFLKLMTTQLQNQDPFAPMENAEFIAQMAQFSTVTGITEMGETMKTVSDQLTEFRMATATNLLGSSVLVPGNLARPDEDGGIHGIVDLPNSSTATDIVFSDQSGEVLEVLQLGAQARGLVGFSWEDIPQHIRDKKQLVNIDAYADSGQGMKAVSSSVFAQVMAASTGDPVKGVTLDVRDYGEVAANEVTSFRK